MLCQSLRDWPHLPSTVEHADSLGLPGDMGNCNTRAEVHTVEAAVRLDPGRTARSAEDM